MKKALHFEKLPNNAVKCHLCHHLCTIKEAEFGICHTRKNLGGELFSLVYGLPVAINIDPIEKKPLYHFLPGSQTYSLGTLGCNFQCPNCQNFDISQAKAENNSHGYLEPKQVIDKVILNKCKSISYTYNEPTIFAEYALDIMKLARDKGIKNIWVSNGYMTEDCLSDIIPYLDAANIDLKSYDPDFYQYKCKSKLDPILKNLKTLKKNKVHLEITTLIIPTITDDLKMLTDLVRFIMLELDDATPWHISKFFPDISWKLQNLPETDLSLLNEVYDLGKQVGLKHIYIGNTNESQRASTYCPKCKELNIKRVGYAISRLDKNGQCYKCSEGLNITE